MQIRDLYSKAFQSLLHFQDEHVFVFTNQNQPYPITAFSVFQCTPQKYIEGSLNILIFILIWPILKNKQTSQPKTTTKQNKKPTKPEDFTLIIIFCSLWKLFLSTKWSKQRSCRAPCCYPICISGHTTLSGFVLPWVVSILCCWPTQQWNRSPCPLSTCDWSWATVASRHLEGWIHWHS